METRQSWDNYFMDIAEKVATRSTCDIANVGCVIVNKDKRICSTGYNASLSGHPHCNDVGHTMREGHCIATVHAEVNAITYCAKEGIALKDCTAYVTHFPCLNCSFALAASGIKKIYYRNAYRMDEYSLEIFKKSEIELEQV